MINQLFTKAKQFDAEDEFSSYRAKFELPKNTIYFDGNSLGLLPKQTKQHLEDVISKQWGNKLIRSWNDGWFTLTTTLGNQLAPIIGANPGEVILADSTSVNLFKLSTAILQQQEAGTVLVDDLNFPTDIYLQEGIIHLLNKHELSLLESTQGEITTQQIEQRLKRGDVRLLVLSHVAFKFGFRYPMKQVNAIAERYNVPVIWDLSHSAGVVPVQLNESNTKYAVGCTYKYLNGGPGAPAFIYIQKNEQQQLQSPIWGWFGDANPFAFETTYQPKKDIEQFLVGTPPILSLSALAPSLALFKTVDLNLLWEKSKQLSSFFIAGIQTILKEDEVEIHSPLDVAKRGSHVIISHKFAQQITQALIAEHVGDYSIIPDFRAPNFIRFGFAPLYNSFLDVAHCIQQLKEIIDTKTYNSFPKTISGVT